MASKRRALIGWKALIAALAATACMGFSTFSVAPAWVRNAFSLGRADQLHAIPATAKFSIDEGGAFVLDRSGHLPLLRFDDSHGDGSEVWVVSPSRGPRGDILFKDDAGDILLRVTKLGGVTVFTSRRPSGLAATLDGRAARLALPPMGATSLYQRMILASSRSSRAARHLVAFDAPEADAKSAALIADAALLAMDAIVGVSSRPGGKAVAAHVTKVTLTKAAKPGVWLQHGVLKISVAPADGYLGRPSSARIAQIIKGS